MNLAEQTTVTYPPPPWNLQGQLYGSIWAVPQKALKLELDPAFKAVVNFGRVGVFAGFVDYQPGSTLTYHELLAGLVVRQSGKMRYWFTVTHMWVDNEASLQGGREKWGVPKELARFEYESARNERDFKGVAHSADGKTLAQGDFRAFLNLPRKLHLPVPFPDLQMLHGQPYRSSGTFWSALEICRGGMTIPTDSPLAAVGIAGRRPFVHFGGLDFRMKLEAARPL